MDDFQIKSKIKAFRYEIINFKKRKLRTGTPRCSRTVHLGDGHTKDATTKP